MKLTSQVTKLNNPSLRSFLSQKSTPQKMVLGDEFSRRKKFRSNFRVENLASDSNSSSDGETNSQKLSGVRGKRKIKTFPELVHEMSTNTRKLGEETSGLLRDLVSKD